MNSTKKTNNDEDMRLLDRRRQMFLLDQQTEIEDAREEGYKEGYKLGHKEVRQEIAKHMKKDGLDISLISRCTDLSAEEIANL